MGSLLYIPSTLVALIINLQSSSEALNAAAVSVEKKEVQCEDIVFNFELDDFSQNRILNGIDKIDITLEYENKIKEFFDSRKSWKPKLV